ncbi:MAG: hypothetical protein ACKVS9_01460 [Phycisphaerae bacterium]
MDFGTVALVNREPSDKQVTIVRRGFRAGKYVLTYRFQWISGTRTGPLVRWVNPGDWIAVQLFHSDGKARLSKREADGNVTQLVTGTNSVSLTNNSWYTGKIVVGDDLGNSALQRLRFWVDTDDDGDFADETALLDTTTIDDVWSACHVGLFRGSVSNSQDFDDFRAGYDNNADLDINDAGDDVLVSDDFATNVVSPTYDNNGNNMFDGIYNYVYDGWDRPRIVKLGAESDLLTVQELTWYGTHRVVARANSNMGVENTPGDGGNATTRFYTARGKLIEERNGSGQTTVQNLWGPGALRGWLGTWPVRDRNYALIVFLERNGDPSIGNDTNPNVTASGESSESPADKRYFYAFDRTGTPAAMTNYTSGGGGTNGQIAERYSRSAHGSRIIQRGDSGSGEGGGMIAISSIGAGAGATLPCNQTFGSINGPHPVYITSGTRGSGDCSDNSPTEPVDPVDPTGPCPAGEVAWGGGCIPDNVHPTSLPPPNSQPTQPTSPPIRRRPARLLCQGGSASLDAAYSAAQQCKQSSTTGGFVICDGKKKCTVVCEQNIARMYPNSTDQMIAAVISHEAHHLHNITCPPPGSDPVGVGGVTNDAGDNDECAAQIEGMLEAANQAGSCTTPECCSGLQAFVAGQSCAPHASPSAPIGDACSAASAAECLAVSAWASSSIAATCDNMFP